MKALVYDAGVLVAADKNDRKVWAEHRARLEAGAPPLVPTVVVAQTSRSHKQAQLRRFLKGCEVVVLDEGAAHRVGALLGRSKTTDVVDASVVDVALQRQAEIMTGDEEDILGLAASANAQIKVRPL
jgi:hypothetical protein